MGADDARQARDVDRWAAKVAGARARADRGSRRHDRIEMLAQELATDPDAIGLGFGVGGLRAYIHDGRFNRFAEDRAAWIRVGLRHAAEDHPEQGSNRSLDGAIASAVEADGGWELSRAEYDGWIRHYMGAHPAATDEQVVRAAAAHNGHSSDYPDRIWANYQRLHRPSVTDCEGPAAPVAPGALVVPPLG